MLKPCDFAKANKQSTINLNFITNLGMPGLIKFLKRKSVFLFQLLHANISYDKGDIKSKCLQ